MATAAKKKEEQKPVVPKGFTEQHTGHQGWIKVVEGVPIHGVLVGFEARNDGDGYQYLLQLKSPCSGMNEDKEVVTELYPVGAIVALNETRQLAKVLRDYVEHGAEVYIMPGELKPLKKGSGQYREYTVSTKDGAKKGEHPAIVRGGNTDDIPF